MASHFLLRRRLLGSLRPSSSLSPSLSLTRCLSSTPRALQATHKPDESQKLDPYFELSPEEIEFYKIQREGAPTITKAEHPLDVHTVEDMHHLTAEEALRETGTRRDATMRHFIGKSFLFLKLSSLLGNLC